MDNSTRTKVAWAPEDAVINLLYIGGEEFIVAWFKLATLEGSSPKEQKTKTK